jgi:hypothetical protein
MIHRWQLDSFEVGTVALTANADDSSAFSLHGVMLTAPGHQNQIFCGDYILNTDMHSVGFLLQFGDSSAP